MNEVAIFGFIQMIYGFALFVIGFIVGYYFSQNGKNILGKEKGSKRRK